MRKLIGAVAVAAAVLSFSAHPVATHAAGTDVATQALLQAWQANGHSVMCDDGTKTCLTNRSTYSIVGFGLEGSRNTPRFVYASCTKYVFSDTGQYLGRYYAVTYALDGFEGSTVTGSTVVVGSADGVGVFVGTISATSPALYRGAGDLTLTGVAVTRNSTLRALASRLDFTFTDVHAYPASEQFPAAPSALSCSVGPSSAGVGAPGTNTMYVGPPGL